MNFKCYPWYQYTSLKSNKYFSKIPNFRGILDPLLGKTFLDTWIKQNTRVQSHSVKTDNKTGTVRLLEIVPEVDWFKTTIVHVLNWRDKFNIIWHKLLILVVRRPAFIFGCDKGLMDLKNNVFLLSILWKILRSSNTTTTLSRVPDDKNKWCPKIDRKRGNNWPRLILITTTDTCIKHAKTLH